ncbi:hypothetical protein E2C01_071245 [Portunus trituberculatus]|uniref:Uncharacterized protein n=1 Tax=Portunus trituberculatus TaxID=210409 RepID=A0A5B7I3H0_PORTR|nr:hypothetical protein [Portunus trituberculatus]
MGQNCKADIAIGGPLTTNGKSLMRVRFKELWNKIQEFKLFHQELEEKWSNADIDARTKENKDNMFHNMMLQHRNSTTRANQQKIINFNDSHVDIQT